MKTLTFTIKTQKSRDPVARAMLDRSGECRPRSERPRTEYRRRPKHVGRGWE